MAFEKVGKGLVKIFGSRNDRLIKTYTAAVAVANEFEERTRALDDAALKARTGQFKAVLADGINPDDILQEAFAVVREASDRHLGVRNVLVDEYNFDPARLSENAGVVFDNLKQQLAEGAKLDDLDVPVEFNAEIRGLYPESRPPFRFRHFDVQLIGGKVLYQGKIAEMATGEGKTLVATLAAYMVYLTGRKVHVVTVNDYLAKRDAEWMTPVYNALGLTVGAIQADMDSTAQQRRDQYDCDITYGTNNEFGFDYLRDNMKMSAEQMAQGALDYAIIDEVDSILIDEARTPLIISGPAFDDVTRYKKADGVCRQLMGLQSGYARLKKQIDSTEHTIANAQGELAEAKKAKDTDRIERARRVIETNQAQLESDQAKVETMTQYYEVEYDRKAVHLTHDGIGAAQDFAAVGSFFTGSNMEWPHMLEQGLRAHITFEKEKDYVVIDGKVVIVDEFTGRLMHGRQWSDGLHQAIEAKEAVQIKEETQTLATITLQNFFKLYGKISGMTGTAITEADEFMNIYGLEVVIIPTDRPCIRMDDNDLIYKSLQEKFGAIVDDIYETSSAGRPVLVGTISIEKSEAISQALTKRYAIDHEVLNAKQHEREASIVAKAGHQHRTRDGKTRGNVTIATNMAGRGTDIKLADGVADLGGLHIVGTERHESRRIDNQLRGRAGRQGDAGSSVFFICFEDDLMRVFAPEWTVKALTWIGWEEGDPIHHPRISKGIEKAQKKVEERNFEARKSLLEYDEVMDYQRKIFYSRRRKIIEGKGLKGIIAEMIDSTIAESCENILNENYPYNCIVEWARSEFGVDLQTNRINKLSAEEIEEQVKQGAKKRAASEISLSIGEYLEDYEDTSTWNIDGLCKWAMSAFAAGMSAGKLRNLSPEEIEEIVTEAAGNQIDKKDCSQLDEFLSKDFATRTFLQWAQAKFDIKFNIDQPEDLSAEQLHRQLADVVSDKYTQREIEYPVEFAMNMVFGPSGTNVYAFESLAEWANKKYRASLTAEDFQHLKPRAVYDKLLELSKSYCPCDGEGAEQGRLFEEIDAAISTSSGAELVNRINERFESDFDESAFDDGDVDTVRREIAQAAAEFLRRELSDLEKYVLLQIYDSTWKDHLYSMDHLKDSIFMRAFAEKDPKIEYKQEGFRMFNEMLGTIEDRVTSTIFKVRLEAGARRQSVWNVSKTQHDEVTQFSQAERARAAAGAPQGGQAVKPIKLVEPKIGRNEPCPCGSGKKHKKCCGKNT